MESTKGMTARQLAEKLHAEDQAKAEAEAKAAAENKKSRDAEGARMCAMIEAALGSFGPSYTVTRKWFGGADYWVLSYGKRDLVSCVLQFETGTYDLSDDVRNIPYAHWAATVCPGAWGGPHDKRGMGGITSEESLNREIASIMKDHIGRRR